MIALKSCPESITPVGDCVEFVFNMTDIKVGTVERKFIWSVCDNEGKELMTGVVEPKEGKDFSLRLERDLLSCVFTKVPNPELPCLSVIDQSSMKLDLVLKYYELVSDLSLPNCPEPIIENSDEKEFSIINSSCGWYSTFNGLLNVKSPYISTCRSAIDWVYLYSDSPITIQLRYFDDNGEVFLITPTSVTVPAGTHSVVVGPCGVSCEIKRVQVVISGGVEETFNYIFDNDCEAEEIFFQSSKGGWSSLCFQRESELMNSEYFEICTYKNNCNLRSVDGRMQGGFQNSDSESNRNITFSMVIDADEDCDVATIRDFMSSGSMLVQMEDKFYKDTGVKSLHRFLPQSGSFGYFRKEQCFQISITGRIALPEPKPNYQNY